MLNVTRWIFLLVCAVLAAHTGVYAQSSAASVAAVPRGAATQAAVPADQSSVPVLPPSVSYAQILRPVTEVRSDISNWSDTELAALAVAIKAASAECTRLQQTAYDNEELLALAHVCALGQNWPGTYSAAVRYASDKQQPHRVEAYSLLLQAEMNLRQWRSAVEHLQQLREAAPLNTEIADISAATIRSMEVPATSYAVQGALGLQTSLLECIKGCPGDLPSSQAEAMAWNALTLLKENGDGVGEAEKDILAAVSARANPMPVELETDAIAAHARFESLGRPLPAGMPRPRCTPPGNDMVLSTVHGCQALYMITAGDGSPEKPALTRSLEQLRNRLTDTLPVYAVRSGCKEPSAAAGNRTCLSTPVLGTLGGSTALLLIAVDARGNVAWNVSGTPSALQEGGLAEAIAYKVATPRKPASLNRP